MRLPLRGRPAAGLGLLLTASPATALGHGADAPAPDGAGALGLWVLEPVPIGLLLLSAGAYLLVVRRINRAHPRSPVPSWRIACWLGGLLVVALALLSAVDVYADELLSVHMVQHLMLAMVAPPLLAAGMPVTIALRGADARLRRSVLLPILHSPPVRLLVTPLSAWLAFTIVLWVTHFTPLFDAALENPATHVGEHLLLLATGALFWWPVVAADPLPRRLGHAWRAIYLLAEMPVAAAVGLYLYFAPQVVYAHYATNARAWGPSPLIDQQIGGLLMWSVGDLIMLAAVSSLVWGWIAVEGRRERRNAAAGATTRMPDQLDGPQPS